MDQELTGNAFKRFMRRRGLSREKADEDDDAIMTEQSESSPSMSSLLSPSSGNFQTNYPPTHRASSTYIRGRDTTTRPSTASSSTYMRGRDTPTRPSTASSSIHPEHIRRTQSTCEILPTPMTSPGRRQRRQNIHNQQQQQQPQQSDKQQQKQNEDEIKKIYRCEYCNLTFGRKHHKERHVANIHRQVSSQKYKTKTSIPLLLNFIIN